MIPADFDVSEQIKRKIEGIRSVRTNSGANHNMSYFIYGTNHKSYKVVFGDSNNYKYNMTNTEKGEIIFIIEDKNQER